ncbi:DMT family transporter [Marivibrio halodurans]|uniref:DMT family transporter n=1 Tax=Marivibrio halodurans TaxID=2039722 RepID=A0A8J7V5D7_9PROT|nr:DMT family transporter [Marivibrio halodurans]MBP5858799.1 DMT family transporter [Marivibrio halodurans]
MSPPTGPSHPGGGDRRTALVLLVAASGFLMLPMGDTFGKILGEAGMAPVQVAWGRWAAQTILLTPVILMLYRREALRPARMSLLILRALLIGGATICYFTAIREVPLADAAGVLFVAPLMVTAMSALFLGEKVGLPRWSAVLIGFSGMVLIVKPGTGAMQLGALWALGAAALFALFLVLSRHMAGANKPLVTLWWAGVVGTVLMGGMVVPVWTMPGPMEAAMLLAMGVIMALGHLLILWAADRAEASAMAPMPYLEMVMATILGYFVFGDFPDALTWAGCAIVVGAGLFVALREGRRTPAGQAAAAIAERPE